MSLPYEFLQIYGFEPYKANGVPQSDPFGGGALVTGDNLVISTWGLTALSDSEPIATIEGDLLKPASALSVAC